MGQLEDLRAFVRIVEHESIGKAAEAEGVAKSAMSRRLRLLEERLQTKLISRNTRQWALSDSGRQLYARAQEILADVEEAEAEAQSQTAALTGEVRLSAPRFFGEAVLTKPLLAFATRHPGLHLTVDFDDRMVDVIGEHYDLVIRIADMPDSALIARKLTETRRVFFASPAYLAEHSPIKTLQDLQSQRILQGGRARRFSWNARGPDGRMHSVTLASVLNCSDGRLLVSAAIAGLGVARLPGFLARPALNDGRLVQVLPEFRPDALGVYCVHSPSRFLPGRVRALKEHLATSLSTYED